MQCSPRDCSELTADIHTTARPSARSKHRPHVRTCPELYTRVPRVYHICVIFSSTLYSSAWSRRRLYELVPNLIGYSSAQRKLPLCEISSTLHSSARSTAQLGELSSTPYSSAQRKRHLFELALNTILQWPEETTVVWIFPQPHDQLSEENNIFSQFYNQEPEVNHSCLKFVGSTTWSIGRSEQVFLKSTTDFSWRAIRQILNAMYVHLGVLKAIKYPRTFVQRVIILLMIVSKWLVKM